MSETRALLPFALTVGAVMLAACSPGGPPRRGGDVADPPGGGRGTMFPLCAGVTDDLVTELTGMPDLTDVSKNSVTCGWATPNNQQGVLFAWYRDSPIGRERNVAGLGGKEITDLTIEDHHGFTAAVTDRTGATCEVAIGFDGDFIEWAIHAKDRSQEKLCGIAEEFARRSISNAQ